MSENLEWAVAQGSLFFEGQGKVQETLQRITAKLNELGIPYAVVGGMAMFAHGFRRYTEDVGILVTRDGLKQIHAALNGLGYVRPFEKSKNLRDAQSGVKIEFLLTGDYPGDGKPKNISFPDPSSVAETISGFSVISLPSLVTLKLASGMTGAGRLKDLADVQELIKMLTLPDSFADSLHPDVRAKFLECWSSVQGATGPDQDSPFTEEG